MKYLTITVFTYNSSQPRCNIV